MSSLSSKPDQRMLAVWFPRLATDRLWRARLGRSWPSRRPASAPPLVLSHRVNGAQRVSARDAQAEALGIRPQMGVADVRAMHPQVEIADADPGADRRLLEGLADWCDRYTPLVALDGEDGLFLDITGCAHLFGGEKALLAGLLARLCEQGFSACAGLASTAGAAWAAARHGLPPVPPGGEGEALAPLPLAALRLPERTRLGLQAVGLRSAGQVMAAPRAPLARRFGPFLVQRIDQALGHAGEPVSPRLPVAPLSAERALAEPVTRLEEIEALVALLARALEGDLERRVEGATRAGLALFRVDGAVRRIEAGMSRPLREARALSRLLSERLAALADTLDAGFGFDLIRLYVLETVPMAGRQGDLAGGRDGESADLAFLADRLHARLGRPVLLHPAPVESHIPERAVALEPWRDGGGAICAPLPSLTRPVRLLPRAEPIEVTAEVPEGPPRHFRWRRALHRVARAEGPERIAAEWWREADALPDRDYFRVEDEEGRRFWLYREGVYGGPRPPGWYLQGLFA